MTTAPSKIGLGGGCHWCTEGVFESLIGVTKVNQGGQRQTASSLASLRQLKFTLNQQ
jgi:peptide methionine sulfoxide reductase MsrA